MLKTVIIASGLIIAVYTFDLNDLDNNLVDYEVPLQNMPLPYSYGGDNRFVFDTRPAFYDYDKVVIPKPVVHEVQDKYEVGVSKLGLIASAASYVITFMKSTIVFLFKKAPALFIGSFFLLGLCKLTPICSKVSSVKSLAQAQREIRSLATPERLASASEFVQKAIRKYRSIQEE